MACRQCLDYWGTTTCVVSSRAACTESAEEPRPLNSASKSLHYQRRLHREFLESTARQDPRDQVTCARPSPSTPLKSYDIFREPACQSDLLYVYFVTALPQSLDEFF
jgi:hypothetical protein